MLAAKLFGPGQIRLVETGIPEIGDDEILIRTKAAAICGSDLRMIGNGYRGVDESHPLTLGHEISGIIEQTGALVSDYRKGMHVCVAPNYGCGICDMCVSGDTHLCAEYKAFGINIDGGFAEYVRVPAKVIRQGNLMVLGPDVSFGEAALLEPLSCVLNGQERLHIQPGDSVLVVGAGPIGLMHALLAGSYGAAKVYMRDLSETRMRQCEKVNPKISGIYGEDLKKEIMRLTDGRGVDVCIIACPSGKAQADSLELMAMNGRILFFGGLPSGNDLVNLPSNLIHYRQLSISGSTRANVRQYRMAARLLETGMLELAGMISAEYPLEEFAEAVEYAKSSAGLKTVIKF